MKVSIKILNMRASAFTPPWWLRNGVVMTLYVALRASQTWEKTLSDPQPPYQNHLFRGAGEVPIFGWVAVPPQARGTIVGTYGITGSLENQWFLQILGRKAYAAGFAVVLFDWRAHGETALLSPTLTSDGLYEGEDFVRIAAQAKALGCPAPFTFTGYSLGGQLALWAGKAAQELLPNDRTLGLSLEEILGTAVICPSLDSTRSLRYLESSLPGKRLEQAIAKELKRLAWGLYQAHPDHFDPAAIERANSIWTFDEELVIGRLGFHSVEAYYTASSALAILPQLQTPTLILYAIDDPLFDPTIVPDLQKVGAQNPALNIWLTQYGGHVGYFCDRRHQKAIGDPDPWWAWNRVLDWMQKGCAKIGQTTVYSVGKQ